MVWLSLTVIPAIWPVGSAAGSLYLAFIMPANLEQFSDALAAHAAAARGAVAAIRLSETRHLTGTLWQPDVVVASEARRVRADHGRRVGGEREARRPRSGYQHLGPPANERG